MPTNVLAVGALSLQLLLPAFNRFARDAELDIRLPLDESRATEIKVAKLSPSLMAIFDGRHQFNWRSLPDAPEKGTINYYDREFDAAQMKTPKIHELSMRPSLLTTNEARAIAERCLRNLGCDPQKLNPRPPSVVQFNFDDGQGGAPRPLPLFGVRWFRKEVRRAEWHDRLLEIKVSGITKKVAEFSPSPEIWDLLASKIEPP